MNPPGEDNKQAGFYQHAWQTIFNVMRLSAAIYKKPGPENLFPVKKNSGRNITAPCPAVTDHITLLPEFVNQSFNSSDASI